MAALREENDQRCAPPLADSDVERIAASVSGYAPAGIAISQTNSAYVASVPFVAPNAQWPAPPGKAAFRGLAGAVVDAIDPHSEGDRIAVLAGFLSAFGNAVGRHVFVRVGATVHHANEFICLVGKTSRARKGDSWNPVAALYEWADPQSKERVVNGLSTGEGLIHAVRDSVDFVKADESTTIDRGVEDKRLLVIETEMARVLRVMGRQGNTLSPVLRDAWDGQSLRVMTRKSPLRAAAPHISMLGHITLEELRRELTDTEIANGFGNRVMWLPVRRSKTLPNPTPFVASQVAELAESVRETFERATGLCELSRSAAADELWAAVYGELTKDEEGLCGALKARAEAHVLRLSLIYAALDGSIRIEPEHIDAAGELWSYAARGVEYVWAGLGGDHVSDTITVALQAQGELSRTQIRDLLGRHQSNDRITLALQRLRARGKARMDTRETGGRPVELWRWVQ